MYIRTPTVVIISMWVSKMVTPQKNKAPISEDDQVYFAVYCYSVQIFLSSIY